MHEASRVYDDSAYRWQDGSWPGRDWPGSIVYELHIGTFTPEGTFDAAIDRLNHLVDLGVTHVELLPVNAFNGVWNWGYDGVDWYAVHEPYGGPDGLKRFVDACHSQRLAVLLDVVYNHLGPSGNYLTRFGPYLATQRNAWGEVVNLDGPGAPEVRRYIIDNALMWLRDFHIDGLRLDAAHALVDTSTPHLLAELSAHVDDLEAELGQPRTLVAESDLNDPVMITPRREGGYGLDAQWDDDVHHALHAILTGERQGLLRGLRLACRPRQGLHVGVPARWLLLDISRPTARAPCRSRPDAGLPIHRLPAGSRPGREPGARRSVARDHPAASAGRRRGSAAHVAIHAHALDG